MKIKLIFKCFVLLFLCSCSIITKTSKLQTGRVLMSGTQYPLGVHVDIYQDGRKTISTQSDNLGYFQFPYNKKSHELTFVIPNNEIPDTIYNVNGYKYLLFKCNTSDTISVIKKNFNDTIILTSLKCKLLPIVDEKPHIEH